MDAENQNLITVTVFFKTGFIFFDKFNAFLLIFYIFINKKFIFHRKDLVFDTGKIFIFFNKFSKFEKDILKTYWVKNFKNNIIFLKNN